MNDTPTPNPGDMDPATIKALHADHRRAAALIVHYGQDHWPGVKAVLEEVAQANRVLPTIYALLNLYDEMVPELRSDLGMQFLSSHILKVAGMENGS